MRSRVLWRIMIKIPKARVVFAWEWGTASGHLRRFYPIASALRQSGCDVILVVKEPQRAADVYSECEVPILPCPLLHPQCATPYPRPHSIAGLAWNLGINDEPRVSSALSQWKNLLMALKPTHLITDFGMLAGVVANALGIPTARIGTGFGNPPEHHALASMFAESLNESELVIASRIEKLMAKATSMNRLSCPQQWNELFAVTGPTLVATVSDFDPYQVHRPAGACLGTWSSNQGSVPSWKKSNARKALAYLKSNPHIKKQCKSLAVLGMDILLVWNEVGCGADAIEAMEHIQISNKLVDLDACQDVCSLTISNANHGLLLKSLSLGIPVATFPLFIESCWNAIAVERLGFGVNLTKHPEHSWRSLVDSLHCVETRDRLTQYAIRLNQLNSTALDRAIAMLTHWIFSHKRMIYEIVPK